MRKARENERRFTRYAMCELGVIAARLGELYARSDISGFKLQPSTPEDAQISLAYDSSLVWFTGDASADMRLWKFAHDVVGDYQADETEKLLRTLRHGGTVRDWCSYPPYPGGNTIRFEYLAEDPNVLAHEPALPAGDAGAGKEAVSGEEAWIPLRGELVVLRSGSPVMTVAEVGPGKEINNLRVNTLFYVDGAIRQVDELDPLYLRRASKDECSRAQREWQGQYQLLESGK